MFASLEKTCRSIGSTKAHINFITQCLKGKLIPKGLLSKRRLNTLKANQLENRFAKIRMSVNTNTYTASYPSFNPWPSKLISSMRSTPISSKSSFKLMHHLFKALTAMTLPRTQLIGPIKHTTNECQFFLK